ncbi:MAG: phospholipid carrier-dependent glycosyltransferase [Chitinophagaceae bacterium]|nr:phospholipid carrier-dependent glycosyltransferase [Chitinophagaceae bacterium]
MSSSTLKGFSHSLKTREDRVLLLLCAVLLLVYLANAFGPLRLTNDTLRYFILKEQMDGSWPVAFGPSSDFLPSGYVYFLSFLSRLNILNSTTIVIVHLLYLAGSIYFVKEIFGRNINWRSLAFLMLLSWTTIKYSLIPLSEMQFLFFTTAALYCYVKYDANRNFIYLLLVVLFCKLAIETRSAGFVLPVSIIAAFILKHRAIWATILKRNKWAWFSLVLVIALIAVGFYWLKDSAYTSYFAGPFSNDPVGFVFNTVWKQLGYFGELFINIPASKTRFLVAASIGDVIYRLVGILFLLLLLSRLLRRRYSIPLIIRAYIVLYIGLIFNWPFFDARFWFPILPLMIGVFLSNPPTISQRTRVVNSIYKIAFVLTGIFSLGYYTYLSYNQSAFAVRHDAGKWKREYELHFSATETKDSTIDQKALYLLNKYD